MTEQVQQEIERFLEEVKVFQEVTAIEADRALEAENGSIVFIGRETCPYCRRFVHKLSPLAEKEKLDVLYVHSQRSGLEEEIEAFRDKYDVPTVPGLLYSDAETPTRVKCDSSLSPEEILSFVRADHK